MSERLANTQPEVQRNMSQSEVIESMRAVLMSMDPESAEAKAIGVYVDMLAEQPTTKTEDPTIQLRNENLRLKETIDRLADVLEEKGDDIHVLRDDALERRTAATEYQRMYSIDTLTGCGSQNAWKEVVQQLADTDLNTEVVVLDIMDLGTANKARDQTKGDEIIARAGNAARRGARLVLEETGAIQLVPTMSSVQQRREEDASGGIDITKLAYRVGGDEFAILAPKGTLDRDFTFSWQEQGDQMGEAEVPAGTSIAEAINLVVGRMYGVEPVAGYYTEPNGTIEGKMALVSISGSTGDTYAEAAAGLQKRKAEDRAQRKDAFEQASIAAWEASIAEKS